MSLDVEQPESCLFCHLIASLVLFKLTLVLPPPYSYCLCFILAPAHIRTLPRTSTSANNPVSTSSYCTLYRFHTCSKVPTGARTLVTWELGSCYKSE